MIFDESIDVYVNNVSQNVIDANALPRYIDPSGHCAPLYPHNAVRVNTVFEVIKDAARRAHRLGGQASGLRSGERSLGQGRR